MKIFAIFYLILCSVLSLLFLGIVVFQVYKDASPIEATQEKMKLASEFGAFIIAVIGIYAFKWFREISQPNMKEGDIVRMSSKNRNHLGFGVCAYSEMEGFVEKVWDDNGFCINTGNSSLIVPLTQKKGVWVYLNGKHVYHKRK